MRDHYCGNYLNCGADLDMLIENGIRVRWCVNEGRWNDLKSTAEIENVLNPWTSIYADEPEVWVSWRIQAYKYPLLCARERQADRELWARIKAENLEHEHFHGKPGAFDMAQECIEGRWYDEQLAPERAV